MLKKITVLLITLCVLMLPCYAAAVGDSVYIGGMPFGIELYTDGVLVCGVSQVDTEDGNVSPGEIAGIKKGDRIVSYDSEKTEKTGDILNMLKSSEGKPVTVVLLRNDKKLETTITPVLSMSESAYKLGLWLKDGTSGIGTVTYIENDGSFAGLGHGVCDADTSELMVMRGGITTNVALTGIQKSVNGYPGQLMGILTDRSGNIEKNTISGVFGKFDDTTRLTDKVEIAAADEISEGPATILCTLDDNIICQYDICIEKISQDKSSTKNLVIKITDEDLLKRTEGIVQGMSGSPIIQNGKLIGAVTHVFVDDPTRGYGIFIENML